MIPKAKRRSSRLFSIGLILIWAGGLAAMDVESNLFQRELRAAAPENSLRVAQTDTRRLLLIAKIDIGLMVALSISVPVIEMRADLRRRRKSNTAYNN